MRQGQLGDGRNLPRNPGDYAHAPDPSGQGHRGRSKFTPTSDVWINSQTAAERRIEDGDSVIIETFEKRRQTAVARVTELVHPEVLATQGCGGGWVDATTRQEVNFNALLAIDEDHIDFVSGALDCAISARVIKAA